MRAIEDLSGRRGLLPVYYRWRRDVAGKSPRMMGELLDMVGARIELDLEGLLSVPRSLGYSVEYRRAERPTPLGV